jgi:hypothetical protein
MGCDVKTRFKSLHIETRNGDGYIELDIAGAREIHKAHSSGDRANRNAWLKQTVRTYAKSSDSEHSFASSQSKCSTDTTAAMRMTGTHSAQNQGGRTEKLDMHEGD